MPRADVLHWTPKDYLADHKTLRLDLEEHGAYHLLLWHMWNDFDSQCEFPMDYAALGGIWGVCPERAEQICDSLLVDRLALLKVKTKRSGSVLFSKRLHVQKTQADAARSAKSAAGKRSGAVRRANAANRCSTDVQQPLNENELTYSRSPVIPVSRNTCSGGGVLESFESSYDTHPVKRFKDEARAQYIALIEKGEDPDAILAACKAVPRDTKQPFGKFLSEDTWKKYVPKKPRQACINPACSGGIIELGNGTATRCPDCNGGAS